MNNLDFDWLSAAGGELAAMGGLLLVSAGCAAGEAALFLLRRQDRRNFLGGGRARQAAARLIEKPERLLTAVRFWSSLAHFAYLVLAANLMREFWERARHGEAVLLTAAALLLLIVGGDMIPKSLAAVHPRTFSRLTSLPLAAAARLLDPLAPLLHGLHHLSRRVLWPTFQAEPYMPLGDLERAIELSTTDPALLERGQTVLNNIVSLSDLRVDELMRPRTQFLAFRPPVSLADLQGRMTPSGYLLVTEPDNDEVAAAIPLKHLSAIPADALENHAVPVIYVPWSSSAAAALDAMRRQDRKVAAVLNEFGETIGILTFDDLLATIFAESPSRSVRLLRTSPIAPVSDGLWRVTGMTSLRRLARHFHVTLPDTYSVTVAGVTQEVLQRMPRTGDEVAWGPFRWTVVAAPERGQLMVELSLAAKEEA